MGKVNRSYQARKRRHARVRKHVSGTPDRPRLNVFRSLEHIYAQVIDDINGVTLVAASSVDKEFKKSGELEDKTRIEQAALVGKTLASRALEAGINQVVFDRGGYQYHGRIKALAEGSREAGLQF